MSDEIELISDGDGLAVIGERSAVERFLESQRLESRAIDTRRLSAALGTGAAMAESSAAMVVGISVISSAARIDTGMLPPA